MGTHYPSNAQTDLPSTRTQGELIASKAQTDYVKHSVPRSIDPRGKEDYQRVSPFPGAWMGVANGAPGSIAITAAVGLRPGVGAVDLYWIDGLSVVNAQSSTNGDLTYRHQFVLNWHQQKQYHAGDQVSVMPAGTFLQVVNQCFLCCLGTVHVYCGNTNTSGATVTVNTAGLTVASGLTDASGNLTFSVVDGGPYSATANKAGVGSGSNAADLNCGDVIFINLCAPSGLPCSPCAIPENDLSVTWSNVGGTSGSGTLTWDGTSQWNMVCTPNSNGNGVTGIVKCFSGIVQLQLFFWADGACATTFFTITRSGTGGDLTSFNCSPFAFTWTDGATVITLTG